MNIFYSISFFYALFSYCEIKRGHRRLVFNLRLWMDERDLWYHKSFLLRNFPTPAAGFFSFLLLQKRNKKAARQTITPRLAAVPWWSFGTTVNWKFVPWCWTKTAGTLIFQRHKIKFLSNVRYPRICRKPSSQPRYAAESRASQKIALRNLREGSDKNL